MVQVLVTCSRPDVFFSTMPHLFGNLTDVEYVVPEGLATVAKLPRLATMHLTRLTLCSHSLALLSSLTLLRTLKVSEVLSDQDVDVAQPPVKLSLNELSLLQCQDLAFLSACRLELLVVLVLHVPVRVYGWHMYCHQLRQCVSLRFLTIKKELMAGFEVQPLFSAVAALPALTDLRLDAHVELLSWSDVEMFWADARFIHNLTSLRVLEVAPGGLVERQLGRQKFMNLVYLEVEGQLSNPARIFETQPALETLKWISETVGGPAQRRVAECLVDLQLTRLDFTEMTN